MLSTRTTRGGWWCGVLAVCLAACTEPAEPPIEAIASDPATSIIAAENALPGADDWPLTRPADAHQIEGFADVTSVDAGGTVKLYVHVDGARPYDLHVYRMGYYGGKGARLVATELGVPGIAQPPPLVTSEPAPEAGVTLLSCANWTERSFVTQKSWVSGMYLLRLSRKDGGQVTHQSWIPLVVRNDTRTADYLFQFAVTSYQAYNSWPRYPLGTPLSGLGRSTYPGTSADGVAARKVSFLRPYGRGASAASLSGVGAGGFLTHDYDFNNAASGWEYAMVRWLERNGFEVKYQTGLDTHGATIDPTRTKAFLSVGHDEYWSVDMRRHVDAAKAAGVHVGFFGANNAYWNVRFEDAGKTMVAYKDDVGSDPLLATFDESWLFTSGTHRATNVGQPGGAGGPYDASDPTNPDNLFEEKLIGASWFGGDIDNQPMAIGAGDVCHWAFRGSGVTFGDRVPGLLGYEISANNFGLPSGVEILARSTPVPGGVGARPHTAWSCPDHGGQPALCSDVTVYQEGSAVGFSTGTIQWSWGLDDLGAGAGPAPRLRTSRADPRIDQITRNVLTRFTSSAPPPARGGTDGYALALDGVGSHVVVPHDAGQLALPLTISAWVRANGDGGVVNKYVSGSANGYQLFVWDGRLRAWYFGASGSVYGGGLGLDGGPIADGRWHHVALVIDATSGRLYVDGRLGATQGWTGTASAPTTTAALSFGRYPGPERQFLTGALDEVALWPVALTGPQIASLAAGVVPAAVEAGPWLGRWRFDEPSPRTVAANSRGALAGSYQGERCAIASSLATLRRQTVYQPQWSDGNGWANAPHYRTIAYPDIDGDDRPDLCGRASAGLECWTSGGARLQTTYFRDADGWGLAKYYDTIRFGDVNADGRDDVCARGTAGLRCYVSEGPTPLAVMVQGPALSDAAGWADVKYYSTFQVADVTGDGAADLCYRGYWGLFCSVATVGAGGAVSFGADQAVAPLSDPAGWGEARYYSTIRFVELDGDGRVDLCYRGYWGLFCSLSTSTASLATMAPPVQVAPLSDSAGWGLPQYYATIRHGDVDGDGQTDVCYRTVWGIECRLRATGAVVSVAPPLSDQEGWASPAYYTTIGLGDVNGDGRADLCARASAGLTCWRSRGTSFEPTPAISLAPYTDAAGYGAASVYETLRLIDVDHDGRAEACVRGPDGVRCDWLANGD